MDILNTTRLGRASVRQLRSRWRSETLTPGDCSRLLDQIEGAFDAVLGAEPSPASSPPPANLTVIEGGRT